MKYLMYILAYTIFTSSFVGSAVSGMAHAQTAGAPHDSSADNCGYCHIKPSPTKQEAPLWNRKASASYSMYDSPTMDMTGAAQPQGVSLLCLSCHDGATLDGPTSINTGSASAGGMTGAGLSIGKDGLANNHPISITYNPARDRGLHAPAAGKVGNLPLYQAPGREAALDQIECTTCHDPHGGKFDNYLRMDNARSALCLTCHEK